jgi:hypothetical protein
VPADTLKLLAPRKKVKLKSTASDAFTGGKMWTFSNGMSVVFKKTDTKGSFRYGFMVKGGVNEIPGLKGAEAAFASEVLPLCKVSGMSGSHLADMLAMYGVSMQPELSLSDVRFTGAAPNSALSLVVKTMLSVAGTAEADYEAYGRYRAEKAVRMIRDKYSSEAPAPSWTARCAPSICSPPAACLRFPAKTSPPGSVSTCSRRAEP